VQQSVTAALAAATARTAPAAAVAWLDGELAAIAAGSASGFDRPRFGAAFAGAARRLGQAPVGDGGDEILRAAGFAIAPQVGADEYGRAALVTAAVAALPASEHVELVSGLVRRGDARERQAVLRVLAALPDPARFVELAVDACRTNVLTVFEAIACDNPLPARCFGDAAFAQMVLKALFVGAPLARVVGLAGRITPELVRMVEAYASERRAAGRPVPADAALVLGRDRETSR